MEAVADQIEARYEWGSAIEKIQVWMDKVRSNISATIERDRHNNDKRESTEARVRSRKSSQHHKARSSRDQRRRK